MPSRRRARNRNFQNEINQVNIEAEKQIQALLADQNEKLERIEKKKEECANYKSYLDKSHTFWDIIDQFAPAHVVQHYLGTLEEERARMEEMAPDFSDLKDIDPNLGACFEKSKIKKMEKTIKEAKLVNDVGEQVFIGMHMDQEKNTLWVARGGSGTGTDAKVVVFDMDLNQIQSFPCPEVSYATDFCFLPNNKVAITDCINPSIVVYSKDPWTKYKEISLAADPTGICRVGEEFLAINLKNGDTVVVDIDFNKVLLTIPKTQDGDYYNGICWTKKNELVIGDRGGNRVLILAVKWTGMELSYNKVSEVQVRDPGFSSYCQATDQILIPSLQDKAILMLTRRSNEWMKSTLIENLDFNPCSITIDETDPKVIFLGGWYPDNLLKYSLHLEDMKN